MPCPLEKKSKIVSEYGYPGPKYIQLVQYRHYHKPFKLSSLDMQVIMNYPRVQVVDPFTVIVCSSVNKSLFIVLLTGPYVNSAKLQQFSPVIVSSWWSPADQQCKYGHWNMDRTQGAYTAPITIITLTLSPLTTPPTYCQPQSPPLPQQLPSKWRLCLVY